VKLRKFRFYVETEPGLLQRRETEAQAIEELTRLAPELRRHYGRLWGRAETAPIRGAEGARNYKRVLALGGGLPAFEAVGLAPAEIVVVDFAADVYEQALPVFRATYPGGPRVRYIAGDLRDADLDDGYDAITFCHVLEHLDIADATAILAKAAATPADLFVYGPNADGAYQDTWMHLLPVHEHVWLAGLGWTRKWAEKATGRTAKAAFAHDEDLFVWLPAAKPEPVKALDPEAADPEAADPEAAEPQAAESAPTRNSGRSKRGAKAAK
jgi:hypothetical protein